MINPWGVIKRGATFFSGGFVDRFTYRICKRKSTFGMCLAR